AGGPGSFAQFTQLYRPLHAVFSLHFASIRNFELLTLDLDLEGESNVAPFDAACEVGFPQLTLVSPAQVFAILFERHSRSTGTYRGLHLEVPDAADIEIGGAARGRRQRRTVCGRRTLLVPHRTPFPLSQSAKISRPLYGVLLDCAFVSDQHVGALKLDRQAEA